MSLRPRRHADISELEYADTTTVEVGDTSYEHVQRFYEINSPPQDSYAGGVVEVEILEDSGYTTVGLFESEFDQERSFVDDGVGSATYRVTASPYTYLGCSLKFIADDSGQLSGNPITVTLSSSNTAETVRVYFDCPGV